MRSRLGDIAIFILTEWRDGLLVAARDFRHAAYAAERRDQHPRLARRATYEPGGQRA